MNATVQPVTVRMPVPHLLIFKLKDMGKATHEINPFSIQKALNTIAVKIKNTTRLKNGTLFVETRIDKQAELLH
jgi:hypothetical protein